MISGGLKVDGNQADVRLIDHLLRSSGINTQQLGSISSEIEGILDSGFSLSPPKPEKAAANTTALQASKYGAGGARSFVASRGGLDMTRFADLLDKLSLSAAGALLAGLVKRGFINEGGENGGPTHV